jgi:hypothetical protein
VDLAKVRILDLIESNEHRGDVPGKWVAETLLWILCRDHNIHELEKVERMARASGHILGFVVVVVDETAESTWTLLAGPSEGHPLAHLVTPDRRH